MTCYQPQDNAKSYVHAINVETGSIKVEHMSKGTDKLFPKNGGHNWAEKGQGNTGKISEDSGDDEAAEQCFRKACTHSNY